MTGDLTTLAKLKVYLGIDPIDVAADKKLVQLISSESRFLIGKFRRNILYRRYVEIRDGEGTPGIDPRQFPVQSVESVVVDGVTVDQQPPTVAGQPPQYGWVIANDRIEIHTFDDGYPFVPDVFRAGYSSSQPRRFSKGSSNVVLTYWAGYLVPSEPVTIPASPFTVQALENFYAPVAVNHADGSGAFSLVAANPTIGQYAVSDTGLYSFAAADTGKAVTLSYAYVPTDVEQAVHELVQFRRAANGHPGQRSKAMDGTTVYYETGSVPPFVLDVIDLYERNF